MPGCAFADCESAAKTCSGVVIDPRTPLPRDIAAASAVHFSGARSVTAHLVSLGNRLLDLPEHPTALVTFNDKAAVGALRAAYERGLRVPEDLSIAGFDGDGHLSSSTVPMLTTVRQPLGELGRMAVSLLMRLMEGRAVETLHVELVTELVTEVVVRGSTGPTPSA